MRDSVKYDNALKRWGKLTQIRPQTRAIRQRIEYAAKIADALFAEHFCKECQRLDWDCEHGRDEHDN